MARWAVGCRTASTDATQIEAALNRGRHPAHAPVASDVAFRLLRKTCAGCSRSLPTASVPPTTPTPGGTDAALDSKSIHRYMNLLQKDAGREQTPDERGNRRSAESAGHSALAICAAASADAGRNGRHRLQRRRQEGHRDLRPSRRTGSARRRTFREEALARLARIYFRSHSPATLADFTWWSGLTATEARRAVASIAEELTTEHFGDREFFVFRTLRQPLRATRRICCPPTTNT